MTSHVNPTASSTVPAAGAPDTAAAPTLQRRTVLAAAGVVGAVGVGGVLAACSSGGTATTPSAPATGGASASPAGTVLTATADVPVESGVLLETQQVCVTQPTKGEYRAFSAVCPHQGCLVNQFDATTITCPCHDSQFSSDTGEVLQGPAMTGLTGIAIKVEGGEITAAPN